MHDNTRQSKTGLKSKNNVLSLVIMYGLFNFHIIFMFFVSLDQSHKIQSTLYMYNELSFYLSASSACLQIACLTSYHEFEILPLS